MTQMESRKLRTAFTLVELLVVIAIIGVLVGLLLPAIQAAREAARRTQCINYIKQLSLGCLNHNETTGHMPTGGWGWKVVGDPDRGFSKDQPGGWIYNVLPYIEQDSLHGLGKDGDAHNITATQKVGALQVLEQPLAIINCPSRRVGTFVLLGSGRISNANNPPRDSGLVGRPDYAINSGTNYVEHTTDVGYGGPAPVKNYNPAIKYTNAGFWLADSPEIKDNPDLLDGVSFQRSQVRMAQISDGTSNTILIGEKFLPPMHYETGSHPGDNETWCTGFNNDLNRGVLRDTNGERLLPIADRDGGVDWEDAMRFGSAHASVAHFSYCDGSARGLSYDVDGEIMENLSSRLDGNVVSASAF